MVNSISPPKTYQEWLSCFDYMKSSIFDNTYIEILKQGTLAYDVKVQFRFQNHLITILEVILKKKIKKFLKDLNGLLENNEVSDIVQLVRRFKKEFDQCLFFMEFDFLSDDVKEQISNQMIAQVKDFLKGVMEHLHKRAQELNNPELEDTLYQIRRIQISA